MRSFITLIIFNMIFTGILFCEEADSIKIIKVTGIVRKKSVNDKEFILLEKYRNKYISFNDRINVDSGGEILFIVKDRLRLEVKGPAEFKVENLIKKNNILKGRKTDINLDLKKGSLTACLKKYKTVNPLKNIFSLPNKIIDMPNDVFKVPTNVINKYLRSGIEFKVQTPQFVCGVRGTVFKIDTQRDTANVSVYEGKAVIALKDADKNVEVAHLKKLSFDSSKTEETETLKKGEIIDGIVDIKEVLDRETIMAIFKEAAKQYPGIKPEFEEKINSLKLRQDELYKFVMKNVKIISLDFGGFDFGIPSYSFEITLNEKFSIENFIHFYNDTKNNWKWSGYGMGGQVKFYIKNTSPEGIWLSVTGSYGRLGNLTNLKTNMEHGSSIITYGAGVGFKSIIAGRWSIEPFMQYIDRVTRLDDFPLAGFKFSGGLKLGFRF